MNGPSNSTNPPSSAKARGVVIAAAVIALAAIVGIGFAILTAGREPDQASASEPAPVPSATSRPSETASAAPSLEPTPSVADSVAPSPTPEPEPATGLPASWTAAATIREEGRTIVVTGMTGFDGGAIAVGTRYADDAFGVFGPPPAPTGRVWATDDGVSWTDVTPAGVFEGVQLGDVFATTDGMLVLSGTEIVDMTTFERATRVWTSEDGRAWQPGWLDPIPTDALFGPMAIGPRGYVLVTSEPDGSTSNQRIWHSADGRAWEATFVLSDLDEGGAVGGLRGIEAGDEGFVAAVYRAATGDRYEETPGVIATGDGRSWVIGPFGAELPDLVVPWGPDWLGMKGTSDDEAWDDGVTFQAFRSANGLDWSGAGTLTFGTVDIEDTFCVEFPVWTVVARGAAYLRTSLAYPCGEGQVHLPGRAWATEDGVTWVQLPLGDHAGIGGVVTVAGRVLIATHVGTGHGGDGGVTFWIGED